MVEGVVAAVGRGARFALADALATLGPGSGPALQATLGSAVLAAVPAWRLAVAEGPDGPVMVAVHGRPQHTVDDADGAAAVRTLARLTAEGLARGLPAALETAAAALGGRFAAVAVGPSGDRLIAVRRGRSLVLGEGEGVALVASSVGALPAGLERVSQLEREGVTAVRRPSLVTLG
jgi:hypothetical protein